MIVEPNEVVLKVDQKTKKRFVQVCDQLNQMITEKLCFFSAFFFLTFLRFYRLNVNFFFVVVVVLDRLFFVGVQLKVMDSKIGNIKIFTALAKSVKQKAILLQKKKLVGYPITHCIKFLIANEQSKTIE